MAIKVLQKNVKRIQRKKEQPNEDKVNNFIAKGGKLADSFEEVEGDHRLTLRIPKSLMDKVDEKRKKRVGKISRNLWILEVIEKAAKE